MSKFFKIFCAACVMSLTLTACGISEDSEGSAASEISVQEEDSDMSADTEGTVQENVEDSTESGTVDQAGDGDTDAAILSISEEDQELLESFGDDLNVIEPADFADVASAFDEENVGEVYQMTGYCVAEESEDGETWYLCDAADVAEVFLQLQYLQAELSEGSLYTITGIVAQEDEEGESRIVFDVVTVESYVEN